MAKPVRSGSPTGAVSRSGGWLIGGALLFSIVVLAWAFQDEAPQRSTSARREPAAVRATARSGDSQPDSTRVEERQLARAPSVADYGPLLQGNVFRPLVTPESGGSRPRASSDPERPSGSSPGRREATAAGGPTTTDSWRGWQFNGVAQLDQKTYALMDQTGQKRSRFVQPGDRLEDATITRIAANEVTLREAEGAVVRVQRVDVMATLLRPGRSGSPRSPAAAPAAPSATPTAPTTPAAPGFRPGALTTTPRNREPSGNLRQTTTASEGRPEEGLDERRARRLERLRELERLEAGDDPAVSED